MRFLEDIVEELIIKEKCIVIGDFNIDLDDGLVLCEEIANNNVKLTIRYKIVC